MRRMWAEDFSWSVTIFSTIFSMSQVYHSHYVAFEVLINEAAGQWSLWMSNTRSLWMETLLQSRTSCIQKRLVSMIILQKSTKSVNILRRTRVLFIIHICKFLTEVVCLHRGQGSMTAYKINGKASLGVSSPGGSTNWCKVLLVKFPGALRICFLCVRYKNKEITGSADIHD